MFVMRLLVQSSKGELTRLGVLLTGTKRTETKTEAKTEAKTETGTGTETGTEAVAR